MLRCEAEILDLQCPIHINSKFYILKCPPNSRFIVAKSGLSSRPIPHVSTYFEVLRNIY